MSHFTQQELECRCGCGIYNVSDDFLNKLEIARALAGIPFIVNRCCSCEKHNKEIGGSEGSSHIADEIKKCTAIDIKVKSKRQRFIILESLIKAGFNRIGEYKSWLHTDCDPDKDERVAWYK